MAKFDLTATVNTSLASTTLEGEPGFTVGVLSGVGQQGPAGNDGTNGTGFSGGSYDSSTGRVTLVGDGIANVVTDDLRGADGADGTNGTDGVDGDRDIPASTSTTTVVAADAGYHLNTSSNVTINTSTAFGVGDVVTIYNSGTSSININAGSGVTFQLAGTSTTGNRQLAQKGVASALCVSSNTYVLAGAGLT